MNSAQLLGRLTSDPEELRRTDHGTVTFPKDARGADWPGDALVTFDASGEALDVRIDASVAEQLEGLKGAVARHLDRFAFREAPLAFDWQVV